MLIFTMVTGAMSHVIVLLKRKLMSVGGQHRDRVGDSHDLPLLGWLARSFARRMLVLRRADPATARMAT